MSVPSVDGLAAEQITDEDDGGADGSQRRRQIIDAAREVFARDGFASARIREISAVGGVTDAMIYRKFRSKEELFGAVLDEPLGEFTRAIQGLAAHGLGTSPQERYRLSVEAHEKLLAVFRDIAPLLGVALFYDSDAGRIFYRDHMLPVITAVAESLRAVMTARQLQVIDPMLLTTALVGIYLAFSTAAYDKRIAESDHAESEIITRAVAFGLFETLLS
ncbi:TetR/AcrR family transcriptional regulator [Mycolicibacterium sphagni]|uniref:TetR/AcrR family transcriptional regulator n=1 Tax=Mycolicibacterium sphagni TaxID=1786 RepID=UPI0013FD31D7|nr:TetR/AcrR family transcriptional regulator [Mycolicibacterium sphagni]